MLIIILTCFATSGFARFGGGTGSKDNPWIIRRAEHLNNIRNYLGEEHSNKHYLQTADIDLGIAPYNIGQGWVPIGSSAENSFQGYYDGNRHIINNLTISRPERYQALFGYVRNGTIMRLGLKNVDVTGRDAAGLVGSLEKKSLVQYCFVTGHIRGTGRHIGGLVSFVGQVHPAVRDCYSAADVTHLGSSRDAWAGGLVGANNGHLVERGLATGRVVSELGRQENIHPTIGNRLARNMYWNRDINVLTSRGGAASYRGNTTRELLRQETFAGFDFDKVWRIDEGISYPYFRWEGRKAQEHNLPPLLPPLIVAADGSESVVTLLWTPPDQQMGNPDGYHIYRDNRRLNTEPLNITRYVDSDVTDWASYSYHLTAVYGERESILSNIVTVIPLRKLSPEVKKARYKEFFDEGRGTKDDPFRISNAEQLDNIRHFLDAHFLQTADINLGVMPWIRRGGWQPIGQMRNPFYGSYNGNGYIIKGLTINRGEEYQGLFGYTGGAVLENISLIEVDVKGRNNTGSLLGSGGSTIKNCFASGKVSHHSPGAANLGGLVGALNGSIFDSGAEVDVYTPRGRKVGGLIGSASASKMERCFAKGNVTGRSRVGGLVGGRINGFSKEIYASGKVSGEEVVGGLFGYLHNSECFDAYSLVNISGKDKVGGLIGTYSRRGILRNSYAAGKVSGETNVGGLIGFVDSTGVSLGYGRENITLLDSIYEPARCYWDIEKTGQAESPGGGEPRTSLQMTFPYDAATYLYWDFSHIWGMDDSKAVNNGYPYLRLGDVDTTNVFSEFGVDNRQFRYSTRRWQKKVPFLRLITGSGYKSQVAVYILVMAGVSVLYHLLFKTRFLAGIILLLLNALLPLFLFFKPAPPILFIYISTITLVPGLLICWQHYKRNIKKHRKH